MDTLVWLTFVGVGVTISLAFHLSRQLHQVAIRPPSLERDELIEKQVSREVEEYIKVRERVEAEKRELPEIDPHQIGTINNWEEDLIARAEKLRNLIVEAHGGRDTYYIDQDAQKVPMDYHLAHDLATVAHLKKDLRLKEIGWMIKKIELLGALRKRDVRFATIASDEAELHEVQEEIDELRSRISAAKKAVLDSFSRAQNKAPKH